MGIFGAWTLYRNGFFYKENKNSLYQFVLHKYYVDEFFILVLIRPPSGLAERRTRLLERDALDGGSRLWARFSLVRVDYYAGYKQDMCEIMLLQF